MSRNKVISLLVLIAVIVGLFIKLPMNITSLQMLENNRENLKYTSIRSNLSSTVYENQDEILVKRTWHPPSPAKVKDLGPIEVIRRDCGQLCNTSRSGIPGAYFDHITAPIDCQALFQNEYIDRSHGLEHAPSKIPYDLWNDFTMNGRLKVTDDYYDQPYLKRKALSPVWKKALIEKWVSLAKIGKLKGNYGASETNALRNGLKYAPGIKYGRVLVIGSQNPWVEACVIEFGAREVVTLEYGEIISEHPNVATMIPSQFRKRYLDGSLGKFDAVVTFSSVEHSGLGRYGDALNPWGDIIAIARAWCVTKNGGSLTIGVMYNYERDHIRFNAGRWYGKLRYPYLTTNWRQFYRGYGGQRVHVFTKGEVPDSVHLNKYLKEPNPNPTNNIMKQIYSPTEQDKVVYSIIPKENGFFIETGGFKAKSQSNTLWLEKHHNWTGLLVEVDSDICKEMDKTRRRIWLLCACISTESIATVVGGISVKSATDSLDTRIRKQRKSNFKTVVSCFRLSVVLNKINIRHIDYFSLDLVKYGMTVLNSVQMELKTKQITVDVWIIKYRVSDGKDINVESSLKNLDNLKTYFKHLGDYIEHSKLYNLRDMSEGMPSDVVFVNVNTWCKSRNILPDGTKC